MQVKEAGKGEEELDFAGCGDGNMSCVGVDDVCTVLLCSRASQIVLTVR